MNRKKEMIREKIGKTIGKNRRMRMAEEGEGDHVKEVNEKREETKSMVEKQP